MPPVGKYARSTQEQRTEQLKKMSGHDFAMEVSRDLVILPKEERAKALRMLVAVNDTIAKETAAA